MTVGSRPTAPSRIHVMNTVARPARLKVANLELKPACDLVGCAAIRLDQRAWCGPSMQRRPRRDASRHLRPFLAVTVAIAAPRTRVETRKLQPPIGRRHSGIRCRGDAARAQAIVVGTHQSCCICARRVPRPPQVVQGLFEKRSNAGNRRLVDQCLSGLRRVVAWTQRMSGSSTQPRRARRGERRP